MKKLLSFLLLTLITINVSAQRVKIFAFSREVMPGNIHIQPNIPHAVDSAKPSPLNKTYFIYVQVKKDRAVGTGNIYIDGKYFKATLHKISTPVYIYKQQGVKSDDDKDLAVPKTADAVYEISLQQEVTDAAVLHAVKKEAGVNAVMLLFRINGKKVAAFSKSITQLAPVESM